MLANCGIEPPKPNDEGTFTATSLPTLVQMIGSGLGVSFLPAMAVDAGVAAAAQITVRPLDADHASREVVVVWRSGSTRAQEGRLLAQVFRAGQPEAAG